MSVKLAAKMLALVLLGLALSSCVVVLQPNEIAVVQDKLSGEFEAPLGPGSHVLPISKAVTVYSLSEHEYTFTGSSASQPDDAVEALTLDGQRIHIYLTIRYSLNSAQITLIHTQWGQTYAENFIRPIARASVRDVAAAYQSKSLYTTKIPAFQRDIESQLAARLEEAGFFLNSLLVERIQFSAEFEAAQNNTP